MTEDQITRLAESTAKAISRRWGRRIQWRELLGAVWEEMTRRPIDERTTEKELIQRGYCGAASYCRFTSRYGWGRSKRGRPRQIYCLSEVLSEEDDCGYGSLTPTAREQPNPDRRLLALWCDERASRAGWTWRQRIAVYLYIVEGLPMGEINRVFGLRDRGLCYDLAAIIDGDASRCLSAARAADTVRTCAPANLG